MPTVKFNLGDELMREALKIKEKMNLTWREVALQGLGMIVERKQMGRPPKQEPPQPTAKEKIEENELKEKILDIALDAFRGVAVWREVLPLIELDGVGYKYYKYYGPATSETTITMNGETVPVYESKEVKIPILSRTFQVYRNGKIDSRTIREAATEIAIEEGKLILVGEHKGWKALGIKGMLGTEGINIIESCGRWPENIFKEIINIRNTFKPENPLILITPSKIINSLKQPLWKDPSETQPPITYLKFLQEQKIVTAIYETDSIYTLNGEQDTAMLFTPGIDNARMVQGLPLTPYIWNDSSDVTLCSLREAVAPAIATPSSITQITDIIT